MTNDVPKNFSEALHRGLGEALCKLFGTTIAESGSLYDTVHQLAAKAGIKAPVILHSPSNVPNALTLKHPMLPHQDWLLLTDGLLKLAGNTAAGKPSPEVEAMIAHEMGHMKHGYFRSIYAERLLPVVGLPLGLVMARHYFFAEPLKEDASRLEKIGHYVNIKDAGLAAAGFVGGNYIARHYSLKSEYFCDKYAAELVSPDAMINVLRQAEKGFGNFRQFDRNDPMYKLSVIEKGDSLWAKFKNWTRANIHAHPTFDERVAALEAMKLGHGGEVNHLKPATALMAETVSGIGKLAQPALALASKLRI